MRVQLPLSSHVHNRYMKMVQHICKAALIMAYKPSRHRHKSETTAVHLIETVKQGLLGPALYVQSRCIGPYDLAGVPALPQSNWQHDCHQ